MFDAPPDVEMPYVLMGGGQPKGLSTFEQIHWMEVTPHPDVLAFEQLDHDLQEAVEYECSNQPEVIDQLRAECLHKVLSMAKELEAQQKQWTSRAPQTIRPLVTRLNGPWAQSLFWKQVTMKILRLYVVGMMVSFCRSAASLRSCLSARHANALGLFDHW